MIPFVKVVFSKKEERALLRVLRSGQIAQGPEVEKLEKEFACFIGTKCAVAVSSGTAALHLTLQSLRLKKGDEVITTPFSFFASTSAILSVGAKPVFVDIKKDFNLDVDKIEKRITRKTKAILPVHLFGNPCDLVKILSLAKQYKLAVIEDACQAHGAEYEGKKVGSFGDLACFSFYATKNMTTGEGGMITTNNEKMAEFLRKARNHGSSKRYNHDFLSLNYRMTDLQAALGRVQLNKLEKNNQKRIKNALYLNKELKNIKGLILPQVLPEKKHVFHQYTIILTKNFPLTRKKLLAILDKKGINYAIFYPFLIHQQKALKDLGYRDSLPVAERLSKQVISLPIHPHLKRKDLALMATTIKETSQLF